MNILAEPMSYKQQIKKNELLTKLRMIKLVKKGGYKQTSVAEKFHCHRNTVGNMIKDFEQELTETDKQKLLHKRLNMQEVEELLNPLKNQSRVPLSNKRRANAEQEKEIVKIFKKQRVKVGPYTMRTLLKRKYGKETVNYEHLSKLEKSLGRLKIGCIRGVYKRNQLRLEKKRAVNGKASPLYDYKALACFEYLHYDTKTIPDKKALPKLVYEKFKFNEQLPVYEYNILEAKSRFRFMAYSNHLNAEFGLKFLLLVIQFIRAYTHNWQPMNIWADNGLEFCRGSQRKEALWNRYLARLNASYESYHVGHDVRKNLIERSHRTDDRYFFIPRGEFIETKQDFLKEAAGYQLYFNAQRPHQGKAMADRTPLEVLQDSGVQGAKRLLTFPTMILEDNIETIRKHTDYLLLDAEIDQLSTPSQFYLDEIKGKYEFFNDKIAQNVLTYYQI